MRKLMQDIKNQKFEKIYLLYGEEDYLKRYYKNQLKNAICKEDTMNYACFEGKGIDVAEVASFADTLPFFADYRLVILENSGFFKSGGEKMVKYLEQVPDTAILIFVEKEVDRRGKLFKKVKEKGYPCEMGVQTPAALEKWVVGMLQNNQKKITKNTLEYFLAGTGSDMNFISKEIEKLVSYTEGREAVTIEDVNEVCSTQVVPKIFDMVDAMGERKRKKTLNCYYDMIAVKEPPMRILYMLSRQFYIILQIKELKKNGMNQKDMSAKLVIPPFVVGKALHQGEQFSGKVLKQALSECLQIEEDVKNGRLDEKIGVEMILIKYSQQTLS